MEIEVIVEAPPSAPAVVGVDINHGLPGTPGTNGTNGTDGIDGTDGRGIVSIIRTTGNGAPGTTDTFTITYTDATTSTFQVYNGADGASAGETINVNTDAAPALGTIAHNNEYRCTNASISTAPTLTLAAIAATSTRFYAAVIYKSPGTTAPVVTNNSGYTAKWQGLDVSSGTFAPKAGTVYRLSIAFDGIYINIYVSGV